MKKVMLLVSPLPLASKEVFAQSMSGRVSFLLAFSSTLVSFGKQCGLVARQNKDLGASRFRQSVEEVSHKITRTETPDKFLDLPSPSKTLDNKVQRARVRLPFSKSKASVKGPKQLEN